jgi:hypothetical protein
MSQLDYINTRNKANTKQFEEWTRKYHFPLPKSVHREVFTLSTVLTFQMKESLLVPQSDMATAIVLYYSQIPPCFQSHLIAQVDRSFREDDPVPDDIRSARAILNTIDGALPLHLRWTTKEVMDQQAQNFHQMAKNAEDNILTILADFTHFDKLETEIDEFNICRPSFIPFASYNRNRTSTISAPQVKEQFYLFPCACLYRRTAGDFPPSFLGWERQRSPH